MRLERASMCVDEAGARQHVRLRELKSAFSDVRQGWRVCRGYASALPHRLCSPSPPLIISQPRPRILAPSISLLPHPLTRTPPAPLPPHPPHTIALTLLFGLRQGIFLMHADRQDCEYGSSRCVLQRVGRVLAPVAS